MIYTYGYLFYIPVTIMIGVPLIAKGMVKKYPLSYFVIACMFILYVNMAINIAIFPILIEDIPEFSVLYNIKWRVDILHANRMHLLYNVILTMPIGIGLQFVTNYYHGKRMVIGLLMGASIEILQLMLLVTLKPINIIFDTNDLLCNLFGVIVGFALIHIVNLLFSSKIKEKKMFLSYIQVIGNNCVKHRRSLYGIGEEKSKGKGIMVQLELERD